MEFQTLNELLSIEDLKRLGLPEIKGLPFSEQPLVHIFSKNYQQKKVLSDISEEFSNRFRELTPLFEPIVEISHILSPGLFLYQNGGESFEFTLDYVQILSFFLVYYQKKYRFDSVKLISGYGEELNSAPDEKIFSIFEEVFLRVFRIVNEEFNRSTVRREEISNDRKLAKYLSRNIQEVVQALRKPLNLPILEEMDKDRFLLLLAMRAMVTLREMERGKEEENEDLEHALAEGVDDEDLEHALAEDVDDEDKVIYSEELERAAVKFLERYMTITDYISKKSNQEYDCSFYANGENFNYKELKLAYEDYCQYHPETTESQIDCADLFRHYLIDARTKIKKDEFVKAIKLRFELFPKGEGKVKGSGAFARKSVISEDIKKLLEEKHEALLEEKIHFFSSTDYLWVLEEAQAFGGYRGYVYPNGKVIFEKFYRNTRNGLAPTHDESYIAMDLLDFIEMAPKSKTELIDFIRSQKQESAEFTGNTHELPVDVDTINNPKYRDIRRKYHVSGWQQNAQEIIKEDAPEYDVDLIEAILSEFSNASQAEKQYIK